MSELDNSINNFGQWLALKLSAIDFRPVIPQIREVIKNSISRNFSEGGRFGNDNPYGGGSQKWVKSRRAIIQNGQTLIDTSHLMKSIQVDIVMAGNGGIEISIGSNLDYAALHQYGGTTTIKTQPLAMTGKKGKSSSKTGGTELTISVPARPYLVLQNEDIEQIRFIVEKHISGILR